MSTVVVRGRGADAVLEERDGLVVGLLDERRGLREVPQPSLGAHRWDLHDLDAGVLEEDRVPDRPAVEHLGAVRRSA
jgi:hypothetical protein